MEQTTERLNRHFLTVSLHDFYELQLPLGSQLSLVNSPTHAQLLYLASTQKIKKILREFNGARQILFVCFILVETHLPH